MADSFVQVYDATYLSVIDAIFTAFFRNFIIISTLLSWNEHTNHSNPYIKSEYANKFDVHRFTLDLAKYFLYESLIIYNLYIFIHQMMAASKNKYINTGVVYLNNNNGLFVLAAKKLD